MAAMLPAMAPKTYYRRWAVYLRGERIGEVLAATERRLACVPSSGSRSEEEDQRELQVRRPRGGTQESA